MIKEKDNHSFPRGKETAANELLFVGVRIMPHEWPKSCIMSYAKVTKQRWRSFVEHAYDIKNQRKWKQDRRTYDALEAATMVCFYAHRTRNFRLLDHLSEFAKAFNCSERTIRRAFADGCYWRDEEFGATAERIAFFSAERMERVHKARWVKRRRPDAVEGMDDNTKMAFQMMVKLLMDTPKRGTFRPSPYAALIIACRSNPKVKLPCEKTIRNYAHKGKYGLSEKALRVKGIKKKTRPRKKGEDSGKIGHTWDDRPEDVKNPQSLGHLEGDTVCGPTGRKGVYYSFIDRVSSVQYLIYRDNRKAPSTLDALEILKKQVRGGIKSITFDRGTEFDDVVSMEKILGVKVYFADPYRSCQRAKNENNHLLVRRSSPKKKCLVHRSVRASRRAAEYINDYPRRKFGGKSANEVHAEKLAA